MHFVNKRHYELGMQMLQSSDIMWVSFLMYATSNIMDGT